MGLGGVGLQNNLLARVGVFLDLSGLGPGWGQVEISAVHTYISYLALLESIRLSVGSLYLHLRLSKDGSTLGIQKSSGSYTCCRSNIPN